MALTTYKPLLLYGFTLATLGIAASMLHSAVLMHMSIAG